MQCVSGGIKNAFFRETLDKLTQDELQSFLEQKKKGHTKPDKKQGYLADIEYGKDRDGKGKANIFNSLGERLDFGDVRNIHFLEGFIYIFLFIFYYYLLLLLLLLCSEAIVTSILIITEMKEKRFEIRTIVSDAPSQLLIKMNIIIPIIIDIALGLVSYFFLLYSIFLNL